MGSLTCAQLWVRAVRTKGVGCQAQTSCFDANPFKMAFESTVACSEAENDCLFRTSQFVEGILVWIVSSSFSVKGFEI